jgi:DNA-binding GntR family transcriptional regulator
MSENNLATEELSSSGRFEKAYQQLRNLIMSGHFAPNVRLTEAELTTLLDVSRGTVRSVLVRLAQEGYLTSGTNKGVRTRVFTVEEAIAVLEAREILETAIAGKAAERATDAELEELATICEQMGSAEYSRDAAEYSRLNRRFHQHVRQIARQPILSGFVDQLVYQLVMRQYRNLGHAHHSLTEHRAIVAAMQTRNPDAAAAAMRHHVSSARWAELLKAAAPNASANGHAATGTDQFPAVHLSNGEPSDAGSSSGSQPN